MMTATRAHETAVTPVMFMRGWILTLAFGMAAVAHAETHVDEHRAFDADGHLYVNNLAGTVALNTWDKNEIQVSGELGGDVDTVEFSGGPSDLRIVVRMRNTKHASGEADLTLMVPANAHVELETVSADVSAQNLRGPLKIKTVSGAAQLQLSSSEVSVQTVSGDITLRGASHATFAKSVSGDIHLAGIQDKLAAETVSGNVQVDGGRFSEVHLKSVSGDMRLDASLAEHAQINGDTLSGSITLAIPADISGTAALKSFSGDTQCDLGSVQLVSSGKRHEYVWGNGQGVQVELASFSGDIHVEKKSPRAAQTPPPFVGKDLK
jgi:DUF4097 and DUF4098 domain-containing protein YvlB